MSEPIAAPAGPPPTDFLLHLLNARTPQNPVEARFQRMFGWTIVLAGGALLLQTVARFALMKSMGIELDRAVTDLVVCLLTGVVVWVPVRQGDLRKAARWMGITLLFLVTAHTAIGGLRGATVLVFAFVLALFLISIFGKRRDVVILMMALLAVGALGYSMPTESPPDSSAVISWFSFTIGLVAMGAIVSSYRYALEGVLGELATSNAELRHTISERDALEHGLREAQRLEAMGRLAGGIAHDFNNVLATLKGYLYLSSRSDELPAVREHVRAMTRVVDDASGLTRQLLAFARRQPGRTEVVDLAHVVRDTVPILRQLGGANTEIQVQVPSVPVHIRGDRTQIGQVLMNLVVNARDAMPSGGSLAVRVSTADAPPGFVRVSVRDTGIGIPDEIRDRIFEPFFSTKDEKAGTGLGLAMSYGIIRQHEGHIAVESTVGLGSAFLIDLPVTTEPLDLPAPIVTTAGLKVSDDRVPLGRVLLVEDEPALRAVVQTVLSVAGYDVTAVGDGHRALTIIDEFLADQTLPVLLVTDVILPSANGAEVATRFREAFPGVRIILMSGFHELSTIEAFVARGNVVFIPKPFDAESLLSAARRPDDIGAAAGDAVVVVSP